MINRHLLPQIEKRLGSGKVIIVVGARQVGKTTLTKQLLDHYSSESTLVLNGDDFETQRLSKLSSSEIKAMIEPNTCVLIDEAHKVSRIGDIVKSLVDHFGDEKQLILTGSSTVNLIDKTSEPLTGRKRVFRLFPISVSELALSPSELQAKQSELLRYGLYPEVVTASGSLHKQDAVMELAESSLYRDVLDVTGVRASGDLVALLRYLALHIGETLSINEMSLKLSIDRRAIERYIDLLAKSFIVFPLLPYSQTNSSVRRAYKVYFWDVGIRNALIANFSTPEERSDSQALWQNFVIAERLKAAAYKGELTQYFFWRSYDGAEVDLVEIEAGEITGYKISYDGRYIRSSKNFAKLTDQPLEVITPQQFSC